jgi:hypothetical protein
VIGRNEGATAARLKINAAKQHRFNLSTITKHLHSQLLFSTLNQRNNNHPDMSRGMGGECAICRRLSAIVRHHPDFTMFER